VINKCIFALTTITIFSTYSAEIAPKNQQRLKHGILIAIEGLPCAGKSTLAVNLHSLLEKRGFATVLTQEPNETELQKAMADMVQKPGESIDANASFLLSAANRAQRFATVVSPALKQNKLVISDGLSNSSFVHYAYLRRIDDPLFKAVTNFSTSRTKPHYTFFINIDIDTALERCSKRNVLSGYENREALITSARIFKNINPHCQGLSELDGKATPEKMANRAYEFLIAALERNKIIL
jgi:dTMP kinase